MGYGILSLAQVGLFGGSASWNVDGNGSWTREKNWIPVSGLNTDYPKGRGDIATFPAFKITKPVTITVDGTFDLAALNFNSEYRYTLMSGQLNILDSITAVGNVEIKSAIGVEKNINIMANGDITISGTISGDGGITKQGEATLTLFGANSYEGMTNVQSGVLKAGAVNSFSPSSKVFIANTSGVVFDLNSFDNTIASLEGGGKLGGNILLDSGVLTVGDDSNTTYSGAIFGSGRLVKVGIGALTLSGLNSTYSGVTLIESGTLQAGAVNAFSKSSIILLANKECAELNLNGYTNTIPSLTGGGMLGGNVTLGKGTLILGDGTDSVYNGSISGAGGLTKKGKGTLFLTRAHSYTGPTIITEGTLDLSGLISSSTLIKKGATLQGSGTIASDLINLGLLKPGQMTIVGDCTQGKDSTLEIEITADTGSLTISDFYTIKEGVVLNVVANGSYTPGTSYEIVSAGKGIVGEFAKMNFPEKFIIKTTSNNITIEMK